METNDSESASGGRCDLRFEWRFEEGPLIGTFADVSGLSGSWLLDEETDLKSALHFRGGANSSLDPSLIKAGRSSKQLQNTVLSILDSAGNEKGQYFLGPLTVLYVDAQSNDIALAAEHRRAWSAPGALAIWRKWLHAAPVKTGAWKELCQAERVAWQEVSRLYQPSITRDWSSMNEAVLDGSDTEDYLSLFLALGEAINGPGGYFGLSTSSLEDCLCGGYGPQPPFTLRWENSQLARRALGRANWTRDLITRFSLSSELKNFAGASQSLFDAVVRIFEANRVEVLLK